MNPIEYDARNGTKFSCDPDMSEGIRVTPSKQVGRNVTLLVADCIEFAGWHGVNVHPQLSYFRGYDCPQITILPPNEDPT